MVDGGGRAGRLSFVRYGFLNESEEEGMAMTTADDLVRARASVEICDHIPVRRFGQVPRMAEEVRAQVARRPARLRGVLATTGWFLMMAFAVGLAVRFGH
jgi:hypothetical protein